MNWMLKAHLHQSHGETYISFHFNKIHMTFTKETVNLCTKFYQIIYNVIHLSSCKNFDWKFLRMFFLCETHIYMLVSCVGLFPTFHVQYTEPRCSVYSLCSCFGGFPLITLCNTCLSEGQSCHIVMSVYRFIIIYYLEFFMSWIYIIPVYSAFCCY